MNFLITGSEGFLGKHLVKRLRENGRVLGIDRAGPSGSQCDHYVQAEITDVERLLSLEKWVAGTDCLIHLAAIAAPRYAETHPNETWQVNVAGTHNVLRLAQKAGIPKVVFLSSAHVYGISPRVLPSREDDPLSLLDMYTTSKIMGEKLCELFYTNHGISYTTLRLFNGYGPGQSKDYFMGAKIQQAIVGEMTLRGGAVTKDWVYVDDVIDAIVRATTTAYVGPLNVGTGHETSLEQVAQFIARHFGCTITVEDDGSGGPTRMCADWSRIRRTLGWEPTVTLDEGLNRTIESSFARRPEDL
jgi:nucleoside-diphosphate-sugar epimerase